MIGPLAYIGGKNRLAKQIIELIPDHKTYIEPFAGGAQVFFHKEPSEVEVLNDLDGEVVNFFRVCQSHYQELVRYLKYMVVSRKWFEELEKTDPKRLTDIKRAARLLYLHLNSFGGLIVRRNYAAHISSPASFNSDNVADRIERAHERLSRVQLECQPYKKILKRYD